MDIADHIRRDPEEGARRLVSELGPGLYGVALRLVGDDRAAADDLYMRALECAFAKIVQYRGDGLFLWLRAILVNIRRMDLRRKGANALVFDGEIPETEDLSPDPCEALAAKADAAAVRAAVDRLAEPLRTVVTLRYFEDFDIAEIAEILSIPLGTVKFRLHRARKELAEALTQTIRDETASN